MNRDVPLNQGEAPSALPLPVVRKGKLDLVILHYMARRVYVALRSCDQTTTTARPLLYYLDERRRRILAIVAHSFSRIPGTSAAG